MIAKVCILILAILATSVDAVEAQEPLFVVHYTTEYQSPEEQPVFKEHVANFRRLRDEGVIVFAAMGDNFGMILLRVESLDSATAVMEADPGVQAGIFAYRATPLRVFIPWRD